MTDAPVQGLDYSRTLYLPKTDFPMRAGLPQKEPEILARWQREDLYGALRRSGKGRPKFVLHDGPPYANGNVHIGTALNKILKDTVVRTQQMTGKDSNYVPGWDCHGLPIEWKVEEEFYRKKGKTKPNFSDQEAIIAFRRECRAYAEHWIDVQREEFKRLGVVGDWDHPYTTMSFAAEAQIAREIFKFVANGLLYRGSKPVMWSVVEKTALAEAEIEYEDYTSDYGLRGVPRRGRRRFGGHLDDDAVDDSRQSRHRLLPPHRLRPLSGDGGARRNWAKVGSTYILAQSLAESALAAAKVARFEFLGDVGARRARLDDLRPSLARARLRLRRPAARRRPRHGGDRDRFRAYGSEPRSRGLRALDGQRPLACRARHRSAHPLHRRRERRVHPGSAGLRGPARHHGQRGEGRRERSRDQGARRGGRAPRARPAQAPVSAQLALEEAGHLPQHAAMVSGDGPAVRQCAQRHDATGDRARGDRGDPLGSDHRREPHQGHGDEQAGLGALATARLGRAAGDIRSQGRQRGPVRRRRQCAYRRSLRAGGRGRLVRSGRQGAVPRREAQVRRLRKDRQSGRSLVRFGLDPRLRARRPRPFSRDSPASAAPSTAARTR